jgi:hypothetical protein
MPVLTFPLATLEIIERGLKHCTMRLGARLRNLEPGDRLTFAFGARNRPVIRHAVLNRLERFNLERLIEMLLKASEAVSDEPETDGPPLTPDEAERELRDLALEVMPEIAERLSEALSASGGTLSGLVMNAHARGRFEVFAVWFQLEGRHTKKVVR